MADTVKLNLPKDIAGWRRTLERAKDAYWSARRKGSTENEALSAAVDAATSDELPSVNLTEPAASGIKGEIP